MTTGTSQRIAPRGFTLVETMVAMFVMVVGLLGLASLQKVQRGANALGRNQAMASELARDLVENMQTWSYQDPRLSPSSTTQLTTTDLQALGSDMGTPAVIASPYVIPEFAEVLNDPNVSTTKSGLLDTPPPGTTYSGIKVSACCMSGTKPQYYRYWNVYLVNISGAGGTEQGKLVQVFVRWPDGQAGSNYYRQVLQTTFLNNPARP